MRQELSQAFALDRRVAVITGAASGIGRETARVFAEAGAQVVLSDRDETALAEALAEVRALGGKAEARRADVAQRSEIDALAEAAVRAFGRLDVWVNSAGVTATVPVLDADEAELDRQLAINVKGTYWGCAAAARAMKPQRAGRSSTSRRPAPTPPPRASRSTR